MKLLFHHSCLLLQLIQHFYYLFTSLLRIIDFLPQSLRQMLPIKGYELAYEQDMIVEALVGEASLNTISLLVLHQVKFKGNIAKMGKFLLQETRDCLQQKLKSDPKSIILFFQFFPLFFR